MHTSVYIVLLCQPKGGDSFHPSSRPLVPWWGHDKAVSALRGRNLKTQFYFLQLGLPSTIIRHENRYFRTDTSNWMNFKTLVCLLDRKHFENEDEA